MDKPNVIYLSFSSIFTKEMNNKIYDNLPRHMLYKVALSQLLGESIPEFVDDISRIIERELTPWNVLIH